MIDEVILSVLSKQESIQVELRDQSGERLAEAELLAEPLDEVLHHWMRLREQPSWPQGEVDGLGKRLAQAVAPASIRTALQYWIMGTFRRQRTVRLSIDCQDPLWRGLPWEYLHFEEGQPNGFLAQHSEIRICRRVANGAPQRHTIPSELRIAIFSADPDTPRFPKLSWLSQEVNSIRGMFRNFNYSQVVFKVVADVVPAVLERHLNEFNPHIVHFAGHAESTATGGVLVLQGAASRTESLLPAAEFGRWLKTSGVELLFLAACNTAGSLDALGATVQREGVPCVVAMQARAHDVYLPQFSRVFYGAISSGSSACDAMAEARPSLVGDAWGIPTLSFSIEPKPFVPPEPAGPPYDTNLPKYDRVLVGREREITELVQAVSKGSRQLITLTGPGGIGKTHLATQTAWHLCRDFPDGVWFVDCSSASDVEEFFTAIAMVIPKGPSDASAEAIIGHLKDKELLLVLDRFEHLEASGCSNAVTDLLRGAPYVSILTTSRSPLKSIREHVYPVPTLATGPELFVDAASLEKRRLTDDDKNDIAQICQRLDGIPWAIIVAASRTKTPRQLLDHLNQSTLKTLSGNNLTDRLLDLVPEPDRRLLWKLSVFKGRFTWEDVKAVYDDDAYDLLDGIQRLAEQSLLNGSAPRRFKLYDIVREYVDGLIDDEASAQERLAARMRYAAHFCCEAERLEALAAEGRHAEAVEALWAGLENFRAAVLWCGENGAHAQITRFAYALSNMLMEGGLWPDFEMLASFGYKAADELADARLTANLFGLEGAKEARRGRDARCRELWRQRAQICIEIRDHVGAADALIDVAVQILEHDSEGFEEAAQLLSEAEILLNKKPGAAHDLLATVAILMARTELKLNHRELALRYMGKALQASRTITSQGHAASFVNLNEGHFWREDDNFPSAEAAYIRVVRVGKEGKRHAQVAAALRRLATIYEQTGHLETTYLCLSSAVELLKLIGSHKHNAAKEDLRLFVERIPRDWGYLPNQGDATEEILNRAPLLC